MELDIIKIVNFVLPIAIILIAYFITGKKKVLSLLEQHIIEADTNLKTNENVAKLRWVINAVYASMPTGLRMFISKEKLIEILENDVYPKVKELVLNKIRAEQLEEKEKTE